MFEILIGVVSGIISGIGMGGGTILIFILTTFAGIEQHTAQGINIVFFIPTAIASIIINYKNKNIDFKVTKYIIIFGIVGSFIGSIIAINTDVKILRKYFGFFLLLIAIYEIFTFIKMYIKYKKGKNKIIK